MSGFEFEEFFGHLLDRLGKGKIDDVVVTKAGVRELLVKTTTGIMIVECRHHPHERIGQRVVEDLHSVIISSGAERGIIVTTGHFTDDALTFAEKIFPHIEMIDRTRLAEMAAQAGIEVVSKGETPSPWTLTIPGENATGANLCRDLDKVLDSYPRSPTALLREIHRTIEYRPIYMVTYDVNAFFETRLGGVHCESVQQAKIVLDGTSGKMVEDDVRDFILNEPQTKLPAISPNLEGTVPEFGFDVVTARTRGKELIKKIHGKTKHYLGANERVYRKDSVPRDCDIFVADIRQLYFPSLELHFKLLDVDYRASVLHGPSGRMVYRKHDLKQCRICRHVINGQAIVCDTCGRTTHRERFLTSRTHGFHCKRCKRTTCRLDGKWVHRMLVFKMLLCPTCASQLEKEGHGVSKLKPITGIDPAMLG
jgi:restriction system protein